MRPKVSIVGAGMTGGATAHWLAQSEVADLHLVDIVEGLAEGKALDLAQAGPIVGFDTKVSGSTDPETIEGSEIVIVTGGFPRQPGMSREDLVGKNEAIVAEWAERTARLCPQAILVILTNPLDSMCYVAYRVSGFPKRRVVGQAGILDSARFRTFIARELGVSVENTHAFVLGGHGDEMVPIARYTTVAGIPLPDLLARDRIEVLVQRTRQGGAEIVNLLKRGGAFEAPGAAVAQMVEAILLDKKRILSCSTYLEGEYGLSDLYFGVPVKLGRGGVEEIIEIELDEEERAALKRSAELVRSTMQALSLQA